MTAEQEVRMSLLREHFGRKFIKALVIERKTISSIGAAIDSLYAKVERGEKIEIPDFSPWEFGV